MYSIEVVNVKQTKKQIVIRAYTPIAKPHNASIQKNSTMLLLGEISYESGSKAFNTKLYYIKGVRGMLRHAAMSLAQDCGIEVCHSSEKTELKDGTQLVPSGFHPLGSCDPPCILRRIFGTFREESSISVLVDPIASIKHKEYTTELPAQKVHISTENRIALAYDRMAIQDFRESYFSGYFNFVIDITNLTDDEIKFIVESLLYIETLGSGKNAGYGCIKILEVEIQNVHVLRNVTMDNGVYKIIEEIEVKPILLENIEEWRNAYIRENLTEIEQ